MYSLTSSALYPFIGTCTLTSDVVCVVDPLDKEGPVLRLCWLEPVLVPALFCPHALVLAPLLLERWVPNCWRCCWPDWLDEDEDCEFGAPRRHLLKVVVRTMVLWDQGSCTNLFSVAPLMLSGLIMCTESVVVQSITVESSKVQGFEVCDAILQPCKLTF